MIRMTNQVLFCLLLAVGLNACNGKQELPVSVASLSNELLKLERAAMQWRPDAYLVDANVQLLNERSSRSTVTGYFQSPSTEFEGILIYLEQDGSIAAELVPHEVQVQQAMRITDADWQLDTVEALEIGLTAEGRQYLEENSDTKCGFMILERDVPDAPERVVWRVELAECLLGPSFQSIVIDANSGEVVRRKTY